MISRKPTETDWRPWDEPATDRQREILKDMRAVPVPAHTVGTAARAINAAYSRRRALEAGS